MMHMHIEGPQFLGLNGAGLWELGWEVACKGSKVTIRMKAAWVEHALNKA